jgi:hypothetical protein
MTKFGIFVITALLLSTFSCKKDDAPTTSQSGGKLTKIEYSTTDATTFSYNAQGLVSRIVFKEDGEEGNSTLTYDAEKNLKQITTNDGFSYNLNYSTGKLASIDILEGSTKVGYNEIAHYPFSGYLKSNTLFTSHLDPTTFPPLMRISYEYYNDNSGNVSEIYYYVWDEDIADFILSGSKEIEQYDNKQNPIRFGVLDYLMFGTSSANNPLKIVEKDGMGQVTATTTFTYTYNAKGQPLQALERHTENGTTTETTVRFVY